MANLREKDIIEILKKLRIQTNIFCSVLFNDDGLIIAIDQAHFVYDEDNFLSFSAISASIVALVENEINSIKKNHTMRSISIQAGKQIDSDSFIIINQSITKNIKISIIFPTNLNLGLIKFELNQTVKKLESYFESCEQIKITNNIKTII